jgi:hypothetical protein
MKVFPDIFLEMHTGDSHASQAALEFEFDIPSEGGRPIILCDLVVFGHVRVKIVLPIELR